MYIYIIIICTHKNDDIVTYTHYLKIYPVDHVRVWWITDYALKRKHEKTHAFKKKKIIMVG